MNSPRQLELDLDQRNLRVATARTRGLVARPSIAWVGPDLPGVLAAQWQSEGCPGTSRTGSPERRSPSPVLVPGRRGPLNREQQALFELLANTHSRENVIDRGWALTLTTANPMDGAAMHNEFVTYIRSVSVAYIGQHVPVTWVNTAHPIRPGNHIHAAIGFPEQFASRREGTSLGAFAAYTSALIGNEQNRKWSHDRADSSDPMWLLWHGLVNRWRGGRQGPRRFRVPPEWAPAVCRPIYDLRGWLAYCASHYDESDVTEQPFGADIACGSRRLCGVSWCKQSTGYLAPIDRRSESAPRT